MSNILKPNQLLKFTVVTLFLVTASLTAILVTAQADSSENQATVEIPMSLSPLCNAQDAADADTENSIPTILQINYTFSGSRADHTVLVTPFAEPIAAVPGLIWKVWLMNEADNEAGGIYLFECHAAAVEFLNSPAVEGFVALPPISDVTAKMFEAVASLSQITRGPLTVTEPSS
jgi:Putative mono-oxygenase ydhR